MRAVARRVPAYMAIGLGCALANNIVVIGLAAIHVPWPLAMLAAAAIVAPSAYLLHCGLTFRQRATPTGLARFLAAQGSGFLLSLALMAAFRNGLGLPVAPAFIAATATILLWNFAGAHWAILHRRGPPREDAPPSFR